MLNLFKMMLYWFFNLPPFLSFILITGFFPAFGLLGLYVSRETFHTKFAYSQDRNDQVSFFMSALGIFYGITLGLVAVGTWENFETIEEKISLEAATVGALYRDVDALPEPTCSILHESLKSYTNEVIKKDWPLQQKGETPKGSFKYLFAVQKSLYNFKPADPSEEILFAEALGKYNELVMLRRMRMMSIGNSLPPTIWLVCVTGALMCISFFWFLIMESFRVQMLLTGLCAFFIGTMIFLIVMMDNPYTGGIAISPKSFELVQHELMK